MFGTPPEMMEIGMFRNSFGGKVNFVSFSALYCYYLGLNALLASTKYEGLE